MMAAQGMCWACLPTFIYCAGRPWPQRQARPGELPLYRKPAVALAPLYRAPAYRTLSRNISSAW